MARYQVETVLFRDGTAIGIGSVVEMSDAEAKPLLACKAIRRADTAPRGASPVVGEVGAGVGDLVAAIDSLDRGATGAWLKDGRPDIRVLSEAAGRTVTAAERDAAWAAHQAGTA